MNVAVPGTKIDMKFLENECLQGEAATDHPAIQGPAEHHLQVGRRRSEERRSRPTS